MDYMSLEIPEQLNADRIYLQRLRYEFAEEIFFAYASKPEATKFVSWQIHRSMEDTKRYLNYAVNAWQNGTDYSFGIRLRGTNRLIGSIGCVNDEGKVQVGYVFSPVFWNQGYATEACRALLTKLKSLANVHRIWTFTDSENHASRKVLHKCGLVEEARLTKWFRFVNQGNEPKDCVFYKVPDEFMAMDLVSK